MPAPYAKLYPHPLKKAYTLEDAANDGMIMTVRCNMCYQTTRFLAEDLAKILEPKSSANRAPFPCSKCGTQQYVVVTISSPRIGDYGHLPIKRPSSIRVTQLWRTVKLGDDI